MYICICICIYIYVYRCIYRCVYIYICLYICILIYLVCIWKFNSHTQALRCGGGGLSSWRLSGVAPVWIPGVLGFGVYLPLISREWKNGSNSSYNCTPFLHSLLTKGKFRGRLLMCLLRVCLQLCLMLFYCQFAVLFDSVFFVSVSTFVCFCVF